MASQVSLMRFEEYAELARMCARQAHGAIARDVARVLWQMAIEYQVKATELDGGIAPEIGEPPPFLRK